MSLKDIVESRGVVEGPGGNNFEVRGLSLHDLLNLSVQHKDALIKIFEEGDVRYDLLLTEFPNFVTDLIAFAAGEEDAKESVQNLTLGVQLAALTKIWELTALDLDSLGNVVKAVQDSLSRLNESGVLESAAPKKS